MPSQIQLVVFDWAGTTTDFGSQAPTQVFDRTFSQYGLHFSQQEINAPMGMEKKAHMANIYAHVIEAADQKSADIRADVFLKKG